MAVRCTGCPARAGIGPWLTTCPQNLGGLPRTSGDRPALATPVLPILKVAPRERG